MYVRAWYATNITFAKLVFWANITEIIPVILSPPEYSVHQVIAILSSLIHLDAQMQLSEAGLSYLSLGLEHWFCILNHDLFPWMSLGSSDSFILPIRIGVFPKATARPPFLPEITGWSWHNLSDITHMVWGSENHNWWFCKHNWYTAALCGSTSPPAHNPFLPFPFSWSPWELLIWKTN